MNAQAQALARAFRHDPAVCYLLPDPNRRERAMRFAFSCYLRYGERFGKVDVSASGAAVWLPARYARLGIFGLVCAGFAATPLTLGMPALRRMIHFGEVITRLRDRVMSGPHWYLFILGADPADTGEGSRGWKEPTVRGCPATWRPPHPCAALLHPARVSGRG